MQRMDIGAWEMHLLLTMINETTHIGLSLEYTEKLKDGFKCELPEENVIGLDELNRLSSIVETNNINIEIDIDNDENGDGEISHQKTVYLIIRGVDMDELYEKATANFEEQKKDPGHQKQYTYRTITETKA